MPALERLRLTSALRVNGGGFWLSEGDYYDMRAVISAYQADERFTAIVIAIVQHHDAHPDHGIDCACMDEFVRKLREMTGIPHAQQRIDYILRKVVER